MKARYRKHETQQMSFLMIDPVQFLREHPLVEIVDRFVEDHLELDAFALGRKNQDAGAPAVHPAAVMKVLFYSFATQRYSTRDIEEGLKCDAGLMFLARESRMDHSTIARFLNNYGELIASFFAKMTYVLSETGYVTNELVAIDGTRIAANASTEFYGNVDDFKAKKERLEQKVKGLIDNAHSDSARPESAHKKQNRFERNREAIIEFLERTDLKGDEREKPASLTDPDARMQKGNILGYNAQIAVDGANHFITAADVSGNSSDRVQFVPMIGKMQTVPQKLVADAGYFSSDNLTYADRLGIDLYLPEGRGEGGERRFKNEFFTARDCEILEPSQDGMKQLRCRGGQIMQTNRTALDHGAQMYRFYPHNAVCRSCILRSQCINGTTKKRFNVKKEYYESRTLRAAMKAKLLSESGKRIYADRACLVEHVFGSIKEYFKFRRFYHRTLAKVRTIWLLVCMGYNFGRLARHGSS